MTADPIMCRFGDGAPAAAVYAMSGGCVVYPGDREQALCLQHEARATPLGTMTLLRDLLEEEAACSRPCPPGG